METIGVRELRQHASRWLARVAAGESFIVTDRGRPIATLIPPQQHPWDDLKAAGSVLPATKRLLDIEPLPRADGPSLSDALAADRADDR